MQTTIKSLIIEVFVFFFPIPLSHPNNKHMKLKLMSLQTEAALLKTKLMTAIESLFADLKDDDHNLQLESFSFTIENGKEEVKEIFLSSDEGESRILMAGAQIEDMDLVYYDIEEYFNIDYLLDFLTALECITVDRLHKEIVSWCDSEGLPQLSLDEIDLDCFTEEQMIKRNDFLKRFDNL